MPDFGELAEFGVAGLALVVVLVLVLALVDIFRKKLSGKEAPPVIECPNKVEGLNATLISLDKQIGRLVNHHEEYPPHVVAEGLKGVARVEIGVKRLLEETQPGSRAQMVREESRDLLNELVTLVKKNGSIKR